jgi:hypothetical protein
LLLLLLLLTSAAAVVQHSTGRLSLAGCQAKQTRPSCCHQLKGWPLLLLLLLLLAAVAVAGGICCCCCCCSPHQLLLPRLSAVQNCPHQWSCSVVTGIDGPPGSSTAVGNQEIKKKLHR